MVDGRASEEGCLVADKRTTGKPAVLWVSHDTRLNGAPRCLLLALGALGRDVCSKVILYQHGLLCRELEKGLFPFRVLRRWKGWGRWTEYANWLRNFLEICWVIYRENASLVYANSSARSQCLLSAKLMGIPSVLHIREMRVPRKGAKLRVSLRHFISGTFPDQSIAVSLATAERFRNVGPHNDNIRVVYDGIRAEDFPDMELPREEARRRLGIKCRGPLIGHIGSASRRKGVDLFLRMAVEVQKFFPDAQFIVVGVEPHQDSRRKSDLSDLCRVLGDHLHWWPVRAEVGVCFRALDVFCTLSRAEPFGLVNVEAALHGVPCVASAVDGHNEIHLNGQTAWLVPAEDSRGAAKAVVEVLENPGEALRRVKNAKERVLTEFTFEKNAEGVRRTVFDVLGGGVMV